MNERGSKGERMKPRMRELVRERNLGRNRDRESHRMR